MTRPGSSSAGAPRICVCCLPYNSPIISLTQGYSAGRQGQLLCAALMRRPTEVIEDDGGSAASRRLRDGDPVGGNGRLTPTDESRTCTIIADEHRPFREGVRTYLGFGFATVGEAGSVSELAQAVAVTPTVDLV